MYDAWWCTTVLVVCQRVPAAPHLRSQLGGAAPTCGDLPMPMSGMLPWCLITELHKKNKLWNFEMLSSSLLKVSAFWGIFIDIMTCLTPAWCGQTHDPNCPDEDPGRHAIVKAPGELCISAWDIQKKCANRNSKCHKIWSLSFHWPGIYRPCQPCLVVPGTDFFVTAHDTWEISKWNVNKWN